MTGRLKCPLSNGMQMIAQPTMKEHTMSGCAYCTPDLTLIDAPLKVPQPGAMIEHLYVQAS